METLTEKTNKVLKDLIIINNDRFEGYKLAAEKTTDPGLRDIFGGYSEQSRQFSRELENLLPDKKDIPAPDATRTSAKLYRVLMGIKSALSQRNEYSLLSSCEFGEDTARDTYEEAMQDPEEISREILDTISRQKEEIKTAHDKIKSLRDSKKNSK